MSTNYYVHIDDEEVHLGKYGNGSVFMFRGHPDRGVVDYESWRALAASGRIVAEHGVEMTVEEMDELIADARTRFGPRQSSRLYPGQHRDVHGNRFSNYEFC